MPFNPEYRVHVSLPEKPHIMRQSVGQGTDQIDELTAKRLVLDTGLDWVLQGQVNLSREPMLWEFQHRLMDPDEQREPISPHSPYVIQAAQHVGKFADNLILGGAIDRQMLHMATWREKNIASFLAFYDTGIGMKLIPTIVTAIEEIKQYDEIEGVDDMAVKAYLEWYTHEPKAVVMYAVDHHVARYNRNTNDSGLYVPELVASGALHGNRLFNNFYNAISARRR